jgi:hypothetical protein
MTPPKSIVTSTLIGLVLSASLFAQSAQRPVTELLHPTFFGPDMIVIPVPLGTTPGAFGSLWSTELWAYNSGSLDIQMLPGPCRLTGSDSCMINLAPGKVVAIPALIEPQFPYLTLATPGSDDHLPGFRPVHFSLRVRDLSRAGESAGTEISVVRTEHFVTETLQLLNVPVDPDFRVMLRIFLHPIRSDTQRFGVRVFGMDGPAPPFSEREIVLDPPPPLPAIYAGYTTSLAMIPDVVAGLPAGTARVRVEIEPLSSPANRFWAFITVTHNETQQITTITPQ